MSAHVFAWLASSRLLFSSTSVLSMFASITSTFSALPRAPGVLMNRSLSRAGARGGEREGQEGGQDGARRT